MALSQNRNFLAARLNLLVIFAAVFASSAEALASGAFDAATPTPAAVQNEDLPDKSRDSTVSTALDKAYEYFANPNPPPSRLPAVNGARLEFPVCRSWSGNPTEGMAVLRRAADDGDLQAMLALAASLRRGECGGDLSEVQTLYLAAAEQGSVQGMIGLSDVYLQGIGVPKDFEAGRRWRDAAFEPPTGFARLNTTAVLSRNGRAASTSCGAKVYYRISGSNAESCDGPDIALVRERATEGDVDAMIHIAAQYATGNIYWDIPVEPGEAVRWYRMAEEHAGAEDAEDLAYLKSLLESRQIPLN